MTVLGDRVDNQRDLGTPAVDADSTVTVLIDGSVELDEGGGIVTADADLSATVIDVASDMASFSGDDCDLGTIDLIASLFTDLDLTAWVDAAVADTSAALAGQYEDELEYYVRWDCSE